MSEASPPGRLRAFWVRHRTAFWALHSVWALGTGIVVMVLARERYGFVPWVVFFLALTWTSTLLLGRKISTGAADASTPDDGVPAASTEFASYVMRTLYQETLFFLIPFYVYSTVWPSPNMGFVLLLGALALLSCLDLVFDRLLRTHAIFGLVFFATVAFAAVNLLVPIMLPVPTRVATVAAAVAAVGSAVPLALGAASGVRLRVVAAPALVLLVLAIGFPALVPPVPLRLDDATFSADLERATVTPLDSLGSRAPSARVGEALYVTLEVFAPSVVPASVRLEWTLDDRPLRTSREIEITAHDLGFRVWDAWRPESGTVSAGRYRVTIRTDGARVFGRAAIVLEPGPDPSPAPDPR